MYRDCLKVDVPKVLGSRWPGDAPADGFVDCARALEEDLRKPRDSHEEFRLRLGCGTVDFDVSFGDHGNLDVEESDSDGTESDSDNKQVNERIRRANAMQMYQRI